MFCTNCGQKLSDAMLFCPSCGTKAAPICNDSKKVPDYTASSYSQPVATNNSPKFHILNHNIFFTAEQVQYNEIRKQFTSLANDCSNNFKDLYTNNTTLRDVVFSSPKQAFQSIQPAVDTCIQHLVASGLYTVDGDMFYSTYVLPHEAWNSAYQTIADKYAEIVLNKEQEAAYRKSCRENRGKWIGGGFGVQGAIKGAVTAGAMNMVAGVGYAFLNGIAGVISEITTDSKLDKVFKDPTTLQTLAQGIWDTVYSMHISLALCLQEHAKNSALINGAVSEDNVNQANAILNNVSLINDPEQKQNALVNAFQLNPYSIEWYIHAYEQYGDTNGDLELLSIYCGLSVISDLKENILEELFNNCTIEAEADAKKAQKQLYNLKEKLHYSGKSTIITKVDEIVLSFDIEARTVDGILFESRKEAAQNKKEFETFRYVIEAVDINDIESLNAALTEIKKHSGKLAAMYAEKIKQQIHTRELNLRTVKLPVKGNNEVVFETAQEAEEARQFANILFGLLDKAPIELYKKLPYYLAIETALKKDQRINSMPQISNIFLDVLCVLKNEAIKKVDTELSLIPIYYNELQDTNKNRIYIDERLKNSSKLIRKAANAYMLRLGLKEDERILLIYDNTILGTAEKGFAITTRGFYSTGSNFNNGKFFLSKDEIAVHNIVIKGTELVINGKYTDIVQTAWLTREKIKDIVQTYLRAFPCLSKYDIEIPMTSNQNSKKPVISSVSAELDCVANTGATITVEFEAIGAEKSVKRLSTLAEAINIVNQSTDNGQVFFDITYTKPNQEWLQLFFEDNGLCIAYGHPKAKTRSAEAGNFDYQLIVRILEDFYVGKTDFEYVNNWQMN